MSVSFGNLTKEIKKAVESHKQETAKTQQSSQKNVVNNQSVFNSNKATSTQQTQQTQQTQNTNYNVSQNDIKNSVNNILNSYVEKNTQENKTPFEIKPIKTPEELLAAKNEIISQIDKTFSDNNITQIIKDALNINGEIDETVEQKGTGDCYLLTTLNTLSKTEEGRKMIKDCISHDEKNDTYTVTFAGVKQSYTFTADEIREAEKRNHDKVEKDGSHVTGEGSKWYSNGDDDAMLIEMAFEKFRTQCYCGKFDDKDWPDYVKDHGSFDGKDLDKSLLSSGNMQQVMYVLGKKEVSVVGAEDVHATLDELKDKMKDQSFAIYAGVSGQNGYVSDPNGGYYLDDNGNYKKATFMTQKDTERFKPTTSCVNGTHITLKGVNESEGQSINITNNSTGGHALAITGITDDTVTVINPWHSDQEVTVKREEFEAYTSNIQYSDYSDIKKGFWQTLKELFIGDRS